MARDIRHLMWAQALDLLEEAERMQRAAFRPGPARPRQACWEPPVDLFETGDELWIQVALPGVTAERLQVTIDGSTLLVTGERPLPVPPGAGTIHRLELPYGRFERRIGLPPGRFELGRRDLALGCLTLTLRKLA
ncbi:MAG: Hsp20/alpha crystallin family protein [Geminicoccaceae bacterium]